MYLRPIIKRVSAKLARAPVAVPFLLNYPEKMLYSAGLMNPEKLCLPDFLCIGAQKAGTSWIYENLRAHPDLYLPDTKEIHYFDNNYYRSIKWYSRQFEAAGDKVKGEITPAYGIIHPRRIRLIRRLMPDLKIIFIMRNPVDRAWSQALMDLVHIPGRRYEDVPEAEFLYHFRAGYSIRRGDYKRILENWKSVFPVENFHIRYYEDIRNRPRELLEGIFGFIGINTEVDWEMFPLRRKVFEGPKIEIPPEYRGILNNIYDET